jgi:DNA-binding PadR family transcriptional regulator
VSSIRLFILGALADAGDMHGHQLRQLAEKEHIDQWTDITPGGLYGAIKRLAAEGLIEEVRTEQVGSYPERQVWGITDAGRTSLEKLRVAGLQEIVVRPDPFDLALARLDRQKLDDVPDLLRLRLERLHLMLEHEESHTRMVSQYLTPMEHFVMRHRAQRLRADIAWHEELLEHLPELLADELSRKDDPRD